MIDLDSLNNKDPYRQPATGGQQQITPEMLQQLMQLGVFDEKGQQLQDQLAMAQALRAGVGKRQYSTGLGGAFGAMGDILNTINAKRETDAVRQQQDQLLQDKAAGRGQFAKLWGF
jgi:hypothetical protein